MIISIEALTFECIVGILPEERTTPQVVQVDVTLEYLYEEHFIDYGKLVTLIKRVMKEGRFTLLEEALLSLEEEICKSIDEAIKVNRLQIKIAKPNILSDAKVALSLVREYKNDQP